MDRHTYKLAAMIRKREKIAKELAAHDLVLNRQLKTWSDSRPNARGGGIATLAGATYLLRQSGSLD